MLRGLCHTEASDRGQRRCLRCEAEGQVLGAGLLRAIPGCCLPLRHSRVVTMMETGLPSRLPMRAVTFTV